MILQSATSRLQWHTRGTALHSMTTPHSQTSCACNDATLTLPSPLQQNCKPVQGRHRASTRAGEGEGRTGQDTGQHTCTSIHNHSAQLSSSTHHILQHIILYCIRASRHCPITSRAQRRVSFRQSSQHMALVCPRSPSCSRSQAAEQRQLVGSGSRTSTSILPLPPPPGFSTASTLADMASQGNPKGTNTSHHPGSIDLPAAAATAGSTSHDGKTPTQEMHRFHESAAPPPSASLSKRRGSDSLSIGIPGAAGGSNGTGVPPSGSTAGESAALPRSRPNLSALASVNAAAAAGKDMPGNKATPGADDDPIGTPNALGLKRPSPTPTPGPQSISKATAVSDEDEDDASDTISDTSAGDHGDDEGEKSSKNTPSNANGAAAAAHGFNRAEGGATPQPHHNHNHNAHQQHYAHQQNYHQNRSYMNIPAHERGRTGNGHDLELSGLQPMRPRQHQRTSTTSSVASSSRREREHMRPFPTPGMKTPNGHHSAQGQNGHSGERDPFDEIKSVEECRLVEAREKTRHWKRWGPYLSERQWVSDNVGTCLLRLR